MLSALTQRGEKLPENCRLEIANSEECETLTKNTKQSIENEYPIPQSSVGFLRPAGSCQSFIEQNQSPPLSTCINPL